MSETENQARVPVEVIDRLLGLVGAKIPTTRASSEPTQSDVEVSMSLQDSTINPNQDQQPDAILSDWDGAGVPWNGTFAESEDLLAMFGLDAIDWDDPVPWLTGT